MFLLNTLGLCSTYHLKTISSFCSFTNQYIYCFCLGKLSSKHNHFRIVFIQLIFNGLHFSSYLFVAHSFKDLLSQKFLSFILLTLLFWEPSNCFPETRVVTSLPTIEYFFPAMDSKCKLYCTKEFAVCGT